MRFLVTGGLGVNGAWVLRALLEKGHEVSAFENRSDTSLIEDIADRVEVFVGDLRNADEVSSAVAKLRPEGIVHLAAFVDCERVPQGAIEVNISGAANLCAAAADAGVKRLVYTSTKGVYAPATGQYGYPTYAGIAEDYSREPTTMYGITKLAGEKVIEWYGRTTELEVASLRFATVFGPGRLQRHAGTINTYSSMIELPATGQPFTVEHGGDERDGMIYVLDVADAIATIALAPEPLRHLVYNVSGGDPVSLSDFAAAVRRTIPGAQVDVGPGLDPMKYGEGTPYYMAIDGSRFEAEFGWHPRYDLETAIGHYHELVKGRES
ncbi:NAD(P)-dependent oxidoreductase [Kribbella turkmenica]|uniref:NAD(P)-dependent oxidoreductase n=1 Tax=Kribbella turkmenica TaxID=2530375 RepID=A0A4R4XBA4_9ACTN|nr:NAD(P)-dependent oxidoreductase [Kribbella turkmenica]TDD27908.1 NAD(P)-dependent oxidoreductase [Kribbella turkmenica]